MSKNAPQISVLTANRLGDGIVVFLDHSGDWVEQLVEAAVARSPEEVRALEARGAYDSARNLVVEPYLVEVREAADGLTPIRIRERVRVAGPSILDDVPGYVSPAVAAVVRHVHHGEGENRQQAQPRPELVEGRASRTSGSLVVRQAHHEALAASAAGSAAEAA